MSLSSSVLYSNLTVDDDDDDKEEDDDDDVKLAALLRKLVLVLRPVNTLVSQLCRLSLSSLSLSTRSPPPTLTLTTSANPTALPFSLSRLESVIVDGKEIREIASSISLSTPFVFKSEEEEDEVVVVVLCDVVVVVVDDDDDKGARGMVDRDNDEEGVAVECMVDGARLFRMP